MRNERLDIRSSSAARRSGRERQAAGLQRPRPRRRPPGAAEDERRLVKASAAPWGGRARRPGRAARPPPRAAELLQGAATVPNAATMLGQSKNRRPGRDRRRLRADRLLALNPAFMIRMRRGAARLELGGQPPGVPAARGCPRGLALQLHGGGLGLVPRWGRQHRALRKPASTAMLSAYYTMRIFQEAGLPDGVINLVYGSGKDIGDPALASRDLAGVHFTGSTAVFQGMWKCIQYIANYRELPRASSARPAARTSSSRTRPRTPRRSRPRSCAAPSRTRARSARGRLARVRAREHVAGDPRAARHPGGRASLYGDVSDFSNFKPSLTNSFATQKEANSRRPGRARVVRRQRGLLRAADGDPHRGPDFRLLRDELFGAGRYDLLPDGSWEETLGADRPHGPVPHGRRTSR